MVTVLLNWLDINFIDFVEGSDGVDYRKSFRSVEGGKVIVAFDSNNNNNNSENRVSEIRSPVLTSQLLSFIENHLAPNEKYALFAQKLQGKIREKVKKKTKNFFFYNKFSQIFPKPEEGPNSAKFHTPELPPLFQKGTWEFIDLSPLEVARQLSLIGKKKIFFFFFKMKMFF